MKYSTESTMKKSFTRVINMTSLSILKLSSLLLFSSVMHVGAVENKLSEAPASPVQVQLVKALQETPTTDILGTIYSRNQIQLTAGVTGKLEWVAEPGSYLQKGDLVAQIELLPLQLRQAEQQAQFKRAQINLRYLERELKRQNELRDKNSVSQYQLEQIQSQFDLAQSDLEIAELQLKQISEELSRATILAPFSGVITQRNRRAGFDVGRSDVLVSLLDTQNLEVRVFIPIKHLAFTQPGSEVIIHSRSDNGEQLKLNALASTIIPTADPRSQTFEMRINVPEQGQEYWTAGQLVSVSLPIAQARSAISVHRDALILRRDGTYVVKIDEENKASRLKVKVGKGRGDWVTIIGDLKQGEQVATRGAERLTEGQTVSIQNSDV